MIDYRPGCENCDKDLPVTSTEAMICAFECTFCRDCVDGILHNVCPNCTGGFENRPVLVKKFASTHPQKTTRIHDPVNPDEFAQVLQQYKDIPPENR